jgi:hypothetical protein
MKTSHPDELEHPEAKHYHVVCPAPPLPGAQPAAETLHVCHFNHFKREEVVCCSLCKEWGHPSCHIMNQAHHCLECRVSNGSATTFENLPMSPCATAIQKNVEKYMKTTNIPVGKY